MKRILKVIAMTVSVTLLLVVLKNQYGSIFSGKTYGIPAALSMGEVDHLFLGSSMFRQGLDIDVLEEELEGSVYILSYNGNQPSFMAKELAYMLERGLKVKNLYVDFYAYTACASPWVSDVKMFLDTDLSFKADAWRVLDENNVTKMHDFYEMFVTANNEQILMFPLNDRLVSSQFRNGGSLLEPYGNSKEVLDEMDLGVREGLHAGQMEGYEEILHLAEQYGIQLLFLETPKYEKLIMDTREGGYPQLLEEMTAWAEAAGVPYLLADTFNFDHSDGANFQDLIHLSAQGRKTYCKDLTDYIGK